MAAPNFFNFFKKGVDKCGKMWYNVVVKDSDDFWLDSFDTEEQAIQFIDNNNLKIGG